MRAPAHLSGGRGSLWRFLGRRLALGAVVLGAVSVVVFAATGLATGDAASASLGPEATEEAVAARREELGLNRPAVVQYADWLLHAVGGDLGTSYVSGGSVMELVSSRAVNSLVLAGITMALLVPLAVGLGVWAGLRANRAADRSISLATLTLVSVPEFVTGAVLVLVFAVHLGWLPAVSLIGPGEGVLSNPQILVLPVATLLVGCIAHNTRLVRIGVAESTTSDAVVTARLNGVPERRIVLRYILPAALPPVIPLLARYTALLVGSALVAETLFGFPGLASVLVQASVGRDVPTVQAIGLLVAALTVLVNLAGDLLGVLLDPLRRLPR
ncbi:ABC transporter permease [Streptomyces diastaticus]